MDDLYINDLIADKISGEWGTDPISTNAVNIIRTTNFTNEGKLNLNNVVKRNIPQSKIEKKKLHPGDTIIEKSGGSPNQPVGRVVFFNIEDGDTYLCNNFTSILRPNIHVYPKYLFYCLYNFHLKKRTLNYQNKTTGIINLQLDRYLKNEKVSLPSLEEQKQIVSVLDQADALRKKRKESIQLLDEYLKSVYLDMFGDPNTNFKKWPMGKIRDLVQEVKYGTSAKASSTGELPYLRMNNITYSGELDIRDLKYITLKENEYEKYIAKRGDLLFNRTNSKELVGKTSVYNLDKPAAIAGYLIRVRTNEKALPEYISGYLNSRHGKKTLMHMCKSIVGMANINAQELQNIKILIPPFELQMKYKIKLDKTFMLKQKMLEQSVELDNQFQSLVQKAFNSEYI